MTDDIELTDDEQSGESRAHPEHPDFGPSPSWKCHHCGAAGVDGAGMNQASHVTPELLYLRPHCESCLPAPAGSMDLKTEPWRAFLRESGQRLGSLRTAVDDGLVSAEETYLLQCPVCGQSHTEGHGPFLPVYAISTDHDESVCGPCAGTVSEAVIAEAYRRRAEGLTPGWAQAGPAGAS